MSTQLCTLAAAADADQSMWGLLYGSYVKAFGVSPKSFQLNYPNTPWNWDVASPGHMSAAAYDFCSTVPQWSAVGAYQSTGGRLSDAYGLFLGAVVVSADPVQAQKITNQQNVCAGIANQYQQKLDDARQAYAKDPTVKDGVPSFSNWIADPLGGYVYGKALAGLKSQLDKAQAFLDQLVQQSTDPAYKSASQAFSNPAYQTLVDTTTGQGSISAPGYVQTTNYTDWVTQVKAKGGNPIKIAWSNSDQSFDFSQSWAGGSASVGNSFFSVSASGAWSQTDWMATSSDVSVEIGFEAWTKVPITDLGWFDNAFVTAKAHSQYRQGYDASMFFGPKGSMGLRKTEMWVGYKPSFSISTHSSWSQSQQTQISAALGLRIGPFTFGGSGGHTSSIFNKKVSSNSFTGGSDSDVPFIFGVTVDELG